MAKKSKKALEREENRRRVLDRNFKAMSFCLKHGFSCYASARYNNSNLVRIFMQKGDKYKLINDKVYDQSVPEEVQAYIADIDRKYEEVYERMKKKNK